MFIGRFALLIAFLSSLGCCQSINNKGSQHQSFGATRDHWSSPQIASPDSFISWPTSLHTSRMERNRRTIRDGQTFNYGRDSYVPMSPRVPCLPSLYLLGSRECREARILQAALRSLPSSLRSDNRESFQPDTFAPQTNGYSNVEIVPVIIEDDDQMDKTVPFSVSRRQETDPLPIQQLSEEGGYDAQHVKSTEPKQSNLFDDRMSVTSSPDRVKTNHPKSLESRDQSSPFTSKSSSSSSTHLSRSSSSSTIGARRHTRPMPGFLDCIRRCMTEGNLHPIQCHSIC